MSCRHVLELSFLYTEPAVGSAGETEVEADVTGIDQFVNRWVALQEKADDELGRGVLLVVVAPVEPSIVHLGGDGTPARGIKVVKCNGVGVPEEGLSDVARNYPKLRR